MSIFDQVGSFVGGLKNSFKNSDNIKNPLALGGGPAEMFGNKLGNLLGDVVDNVKKAVGEIAPQFASKADAEDSLFNKQPAWLDPRDAESVGLDERTGKAHPTMTHIRNFVRVEFLRREHNFGMMYPDGGEYAGNDPMSFGKKDPGFKQGESNFDSGASNFTNDVVMLDYPKGPGQGLKAEMFMSDDYVGKTYKGPKAAWTRVVSNSIVKKEGNKGEFEGFVLHGVDNFDESYGFAKPDGGSPGDCVLGYDVKKRPHFMQERDFKHRPPPGITGIESEEMGVGKNQRKTTIKFTCWSRSQVDYVSPYFFTPGNTLLVEWGWNTFDRSMLINLDEGVGYPPTTKLGKDLRGDDTKKVNATREKDPDYALAPITKFQDETLYELDEGKGLVALWNSTMAARRRLRDGKGNYSFCLGMISNFTYSLRDDGGYDCTVELMSMAFFAQQLQLPASNKSSGETETDDERQLNLREFIDIHLVEMIETGDDDPDDWFDWGNDGMTDRAYASVKNNYGSGGKLNGQGRYFSFGSTDQGVVGVDDNKQYMCGSPADGKYLTVGFLIDIFNVFFGAESEETGATMFNFKVADKRCVAHPNIKSADGAVLLIPNSMAPRHNLKNYAKTTIGLAGEGDKTGFNDKNPINNSVIFDKLAEAGDTDPQTQAFIEVVQSMNPGKSIKSLEDAMDQSPRDDLHRLMTLHPEMDDGLGVSKTSAYSKSNKGGVKPFPDYELLDDNTPSMGYSGRIQDLFVHYDVVRDAVFNGQTATSMLKTILKKMSTAAGGIWDFDLVGEDQSSPNNTVLTVIDRRMSTNTVDEMQRSDKTYVFKAHQKNSIVRSMSCDVSIPGDVAAMVLYGPDSENPNSNFYARKPQDRLLKRANPLSDDGKAIAKKHSLVQGSSDIPSEEKFLVGIKVYKGATGIEEEFKKARKARANERYDRNDGSDQSGDAGLDLDDVGGDDTGDDAQTGVGATKSGGSASSGKVIDIEFVDPNRDRMLKLLRKDKDPKNCIKYNMPLDGIELSLQIDGIEGIRLWDMFNCTGVPTKYYMNGLWRVTSIKHDISGNDWKTDISAQFSPNSADAFVE